MRHGVGGVIIGRVHFRSAFDFLSLFFPLISDLYATLYVDYMFVIISEEVKILTEPPPPSPYHLTNLQKHIETHKSILLKTLSVTLRYFVFYLLTIVCIYVTVIYLDIPT